MTATAGAPPRRRGYAGAEPARVLVLAWLALALTAACGSGDTGSRSTAAPAAARTSSARACASTGARKEARSRFLGNAGIAYGVFDRYLLAPYRAGRLGAGAGGRSEAGTKAAAAGLLAADQLRRARDNAAADPTLCRLAAPLEAASAALDGLAGRIRTASWNPGDLTRADLLLQQIAREAAGLGAPIHAR